MNLTEFILHANVVHLCPDHSSSRESSHKEDFYSSSFIYIYSFKDFSPLQNIITTHPQSKVNSSVAVTMAKTSSGDLSAASLRRPDLHPTSHGLCSVSDKILMVNIHFHSVLPVKGMEMMNKMQYHMLYNNNKNSTK